MTTVRLKRLGISLFGALTLLSAPIDARESKPKGPEVIKVTNSGRKDPKQDLSGKGQTALKKSYDLLEKQKYDEAIAVLDGLMAGKMSNYEKAKALQIKSQVLYEQEKIPEAIEASKAAIAADGLSNVEHIQQKLNLAQLYAMNEKYAEATAAWDDWAKDAPKIKGSDYAVQAQSFYYLDKFQEAIGMIDKAMATGDKPENSWTQLKINSLYSLQKYDDAVAYLRELLKGSPDNMTYITMLASSFIEQQKYDDALKVLADAKQRGLIKDPKQWKQIWQLYQYANKPAESAAIIEEALKSGVVTADADLYIDLGENYFTTEPPKYDLALAAFDKAAAMSATNGTADMWRCQVMIELDNRAKEAKSACESAIKKGNIKQIGNAYYLLGVSEYTLGNMPAAKAALTKAQGYSESKGNATGLLKDVVKRLGKGGK
jgi:tetratricopeptide (TPR) repeat protein